MELLVVLIQLVSAGDVASRDDDAGHSGREMSECMSKKKGPRRWGVLKRRGIPSRVAT